MLENETQNAAASTQQSENKPIETDKKTPKSLPNLAPLEEHFSELFERKMQKYWADLIRAIDSKYQGDNGKVISDFLIEANKPELFKDAKALTRELLRRFRHKYNPTAEGQPSVEGLKKEGLKSFYSCTISCTDEQLTAYLELGDFLARTRTYVKKE